MWSCMLLAKVASLSFSAIEKPGETPPNGNAYKASPRNMGTVWTDVVLPAISSSTKMFFFLVDSVLDSSHQFRESFRDMDSHAYIPRKWPDHPRRGKLFKNCSGFLKRIFTERTVKIFLIHR